MKSLNQEILKFEYDQNFKDQDFYVSKSNEFSFILLKLSIFLQVLFKDHSSVTTSMLVTRFLDINSW